MKKKSKKKLSKDQLELALRRYHEETLIIGQALIQEGEDDIDFIIDRADEMILEGFSFARILNMPPEYCPECSKEQKKGKGK